MRRSTYLNSQLGAATTSSTVTCPFAGSHDAEGTGVLTGEGLLAFMRSRVTANGVPSFVAVRLFRPR